MDIGELLALAAAFVALAGAIGASHRWARHRAPRRSWRVAVHTVALLLLLALSGLTVVGLTRIIDAEGSSSTTEETSGSSQEASTSTGPNGTDTQPEPPPTTTTEPEPPPTTTPEPEPQPTDADPQDVVTGPSEAQWVCSPTLSGGQVCDDTFDGVHAEWTCERNAGCSGTLGGDASVSWDCDRQVLPPVGECSGTFAGITASWVCGTSCSGTIAQENMGWTSSPGVRSYSGTLGASRYTWSCEMFGVACDGVVPFAMAAVSTS